MMKRTMINLAVLVALLFGGVLMSDNVQAAEPTTPGVYNCQADYTMVFNNDARQTGTVNAILTIGDGTRVELPDGFPPINDPYTMDDLADFFYTLRDCVEANG